jgi:hypothetical protein
MGDEGPYRPEVVNNGDGVGNINDLGELEKLRKQALGVVVI